MQDSRTGGVPVWARGELQTEEGSPLVTLCGLVRRHMDHPPFMASKLAAEHVLDALEQAGVREFFAWRSGLPARPVAADDEWRSCFCSGDEWIEGSAAFELHNRKAWSEKLPGAIDPDRYWDMPLEEARQRGLISDGVPAPGFGPIAKDAKGMPVLQMFREQWSSLPALPALRGPEGLLALLRHEWATMVQDSVSLEAGTAGSVAMLAGVANALFGVGSETSAQVVAAVPRGVSGLPDAIATTVRHADRVPLTTFEPKHDSDRLGPLRTDPADQATPGGKLCSLDDLVSWVRYQDDGMPRRPAAAAVVDKLTSAAPPLYLTNVDNWATRLPVEHEWRREVKPSAAMRAGVRPWRCSDGSFDVRWIDAKPASPGVPGLYGEAGAWRVLYEAWCIADDAVRDKAKRVHGATLQRLAIPMHVAVELFGYGLEPTDEASTTRAPVPAPDLHLVIHKIGSQVAPVELKATKRPGEKWAGHLEKLLSQFNYLTGPEPSGEGLKAYQAHEKLAAVWGVSESNIRQARLKAKKQADKAARNAEAEPPAWQKRESA